MPWIINPGGGGGGGGGGGSGAGWKTIFDLDFTAQTPASLPTDGPVSVGGIAFTKINSANETVHAAIGLAGLVLTPSSTSDYNGSIRTLPGLWLALSQLLPANYDWDSPIRVYTSLTNNNTASYDGACVALDHNDVTTFGFVAKYGYQLGGVTGVATQVQYNSSNAGYNIQTFANSTSTTLVVDCAQGLAGNSVTALVGAAYAGGAWPAAQALLTGPRATLTNSTVSPNQYAGGHPVTSWGVLLGAQRAGSATALVIAYNRLRIDVKT